MDEQILIKLYTVAVHTLKMCMKGDNSVLKYFKGDDQLWKIRRIFSDIAYSSSFFVNPCLCESCNLDHVFSYSQLSEASHRFTMASLRLLANVRKREKLKGILKSISTIKTLVCIYIQSIYYRHQIYQVYQYIYNDTVMVFLLVIQKTISYFRIFKVARVFCLVFQVFLYYIITKCSKSLKLWFP